MPTQGRHEWLAIDARQGGDVELLRPQGLLVVGVLVGPLTVEEEVARLEGVTTVLLLPLQGLLGDVALGEAVDEPLQAGDRLGGVKDDLGVVVVEPTSGGVDELRGAAGQALILGELAAEPTNVLVLGKGPDLVDGSLDLIPGRGDRDAGLSQEVLAVEHHRRIGGMGDGEDLVLVHARLPDGFQDVVILELVLGQLDHPPVGGELRDPDIVQGDDVVGVGVDSGGVDEGSALLVGLGGELDELDLLTGMSLVPLIDPGLHLAARVVLALDPGDRSGAFKGDGAVVVSVGGGAGPDGGQCRSQGRALDELTTG